MNKQVTILLFLIFSLKVSFSQYPVGSWIDNMSYNEGLFVAAGADKILCATASGIIVYDPAFSSVSKLSTINGLSETGLATLAWSAESETFIIAYSNTNVDLVRGSRITNMPDILRKNIPDPKQIYRIRTKGARAYLACSFGIVVIDLTKDEVYDTWKPGSGSDPNPVFDITFLNDRIIAATATGVYEAGLSDPGLAFFDNWDRNNGLPAPSASYNNIVAAGDKIFVNRTEAVPSSDSVFMWNGSWQFLYKTASVPNLSFESVSENEIIISSASSIRTLNGNGVLISELTEYGGTPATPSNAIRAGTTLWVADRKNGLVAVYNTSGYEVFRPAGPGHNNLVNLRAENGNLYMAGGAVDASWENTWTTMMVSALEDNQWLTIPESAFRDPLRVIPGNNNNFFISTWGMGLLEYSGTELINHYNQNNSPLNSMVPGQPYVRVCGLAFDKNENLWVTHSGVENNLKVLRADRTWVTIPVTINAPTIGDIIITRTGKKWIVLPRGHGIFVFDDKNTLSAFDDDTYRKMTVVDTEDNIIPFIYCTTEDLEGNIWVGTDQGPVIYFNPERVFSEDIRAVRIKIPRNDGSGLADYLLNTEQITSISIDGANRKWIGTQNSGAYLLSADGLTTIRHYTKENSPLPSNTILSISFDLSNGIVWFGTPEGLVSQRGDAPEGKDELKNVYSFPNPVRHDYNGNVTITGLVRDTNVKITDISGNLVFETTSTGSDATWNLMNYKGERVATGVYMALCSTPDGTGSTVIKIMVMR